MPAFGKEIHRLTHWCKKSNIGKNSPFVNSQLPKVLDLRQNNLCDSHLWKDSLLFVARLQFFVLQDVSGQTVLTA